MRRAKPLRSTHKPLQTYVTVEERKVIKAQAKRYNLSTSAFIRAVCLGLKLGPTVDDVDRARQERIRIRTGGTQP